MDAAHRVRGIFEDSISALGEAAETLAPAIVRAADLTADVLLQNGKILTCGIGGSAAGAQHFAAMMLNRFNIERPGLPAIALTSDTAVLTSIIEDYQFAEMFARQVRALGESGDMLLALSPSGSSHSVIHAVEAAHDRHMRVILLSGREGGRASELMRDDDVEIRAPSWRGSCINEIHMTTMHAICHLIDRHLLGQED